MLSERSKKTRHSFNSQFTEISSTANAPNTPLSDHLVYGTDSTCTLKQFQNLL